MAPGAKPTPAPALPLAWPESLAGPTGLQSRRQPLPPPPPHARAHTGPLHDTSPAPPAPHQPTPLYSPHPRQSQGPYKRSIPPPPPPLGAACSLPFPLGNTRWLAASSPQAAGCLVNILCLAAVLPKEGIESKSPGPARHGRPALYCQPSSGQLRQLQPLQLEEQPARLPRPAGQGGQASHKPPRHK